MAVTLNLTGSIKVQIVTNNRGQQLQAAAIKVGEEVPLERGTKNAMITLAGISTSRRVPIKNV